MSKNHGNVISRRNFLIGLGVLGSGAMTCVCGGTVGTGLFLLSQGASSETPTIAPISPIPTASQYIEMPPVISRNSWGALPPNHNAPNETDFYNQDNPNGWRVYDGELDESYQTVIIHHSAFYEDNDLDTLLEVQNVHRNDRGWADIAYHYLIGQNGLIYEGRDIQVRGTHVEGYNSGSLGICLLGNFVVQAPTTAQLLRTLELINWASERLRLTHIASHRNFNTLTECPGDNLVPYIDQFAESAGLITGTGGYIAPSAAIICPCCNSRQII